MRSSDDSTLIGIGAGLLVGGLFAGAAALLVNEAKGLRKSAKDFREELENQSRTELVRNSNEVKGKVDLVSRDVSTLNTEVTRLRTDVDRAFQSQRGRVAEQGVYIVAALLLLLIVVANVVTRAVEGTARDVVLGIDSVATGALLAIAILLWGFRRKESSSDKKA